MIFDHTLKVMIWYSMIVLIFFCVSPSPVRVYMITQNIEWINRGWWWWGFDSNWWFQFSFALRWLLLILSLPFWNNQNHDMPIGNHLIFVYFYRHILQFLAEWRFHFYLGPIVLPNVQHWILPFHRTNPSFQRCIWCNIEFYHRWGNSIFYIRWLCLRELITM